ncbi:MAG: glycosyltransferase [candidate division WOR-3 bacterium]|nr:glycosyltransferase [candidate division WOR-3 bacterium]MCX7947076.1 glycosyltransferase [candidate division WOR-3 bacterium]MDW8149883.1 glycosyltransferase [candidate division WOR-3 bacterium]
MKKVLILGDFSSKHTILWFDTYSKYFNTYGFTLQEPIIKDERVFYLKTSIKSEKLKYSLSINSLKNFIEKTKPDIIHAHFIQNYGLMAYLLKKPYILSIWGRDLLSIAYKPFRKAISRSIIKSAKIVHTDAYILNWILINEFNINPSKIINFPFGLENAIINEKLEPLSFEFFKIVEYRKHIDSIYNQSRLIKAIKIVKENGYKNFKLFLLSHGIDTEKYKKLVKEYKLEEFVEFKGSSYSEILQELKSSHIYVSTSLVDSTSVSLLEAMNFGALPVVSDIWSNFEWVIDGYNGLLFNPLIEKDIAKKVIIAMDMDFINRARRINKEIIKLKANWNMNFEKFIEFIEGYIQDNLTLKLKKAKPWSYI